MDCVEFLLSAAAWHGAGFVLRGFSAFRLQRPAVFPCCGVVLPGETRSLFFVVLHEGIGAARSAQL